MNEEVGRSSVGDFGIELVFSMSRGSRRGGFERLRDVVVQHWKAWSERHLESYLRALWETELRETTREFNKMVEVRRKAPTLKQFAKHAVDPTNRWFGGDVSQLYRALGEKCPTATVRRRALRIPASAFAQSVFSAIGGIPTTWEELAKTIVGGDRERQNEEWRAHQNREKFAELSLRYVQLREALDRPPTLKEFGPGTFEYPARALDAELLEKVDPFHPSTRSREERLADMEVAWERYAAAIEWCVSTQEAS